MKERKKILFVLPWSGKGAAGIEQQIIVLSNALAKRSFQIWVIVISEKGIDERLIRSRFHSEIDVRVISVSRAREAILLLAKEIKRIRPDILIPNAPNISVITILASWLALVFCPIISVNHGMDFTHRRARMEQRFVEFYSKKIVVISEGLKQNLIRSLGSSANKIEMIYNAFDFEEIERKSTESADDLNNPLFKDKKRLIFVGRLDEQSKALRVLLNAIALLKKNNDHFILLLVGDGPDKGMLENFGKELGIDALIFFLGWKQNPYPYIKTSDVLVLSSPSEGFGRVLVEALALGIQVVSTDCPGGPSEILGQGIYGVLTPVGNAELLAKAILQALEHPIDSNQLKERARTFSWEASVKVYETLINHVA